MERIKPETKICKHCGTVIPYSAKICPQCRKRVKASKILIVGGIFFALCFLILITPSDDNNDTPSDKNPKAVGKVSETTEQSTEVKNIFEVGDVVETSDLKISFLSAKKYKSENQFIEPKKGNKFYRFEFEFENIGNSDEAISAFMNWSCYADGYACDQSWVGDDVLDATISPGKKAKGAIYFEVPKKAKEIVVEYETNFWTEHKVVFKVK